MVMRFRMQRALSASGSPDPDPRSSPGTVPDAALVELPSRPDGRILLGLSGTTGNTAAVEVWGLVETIVTAGPITQAQRAARKWHLISAAVTVTAGALVELLLGSYPGIVYLRVTTLPAANATLLMSPEGAVPQARVRRVPTLGFTDGLIERLEADADNVTLVGSKVSGWADTSESANAHNYAQTTDAIRPLWNQAQVAGYSSVRFDAGLFMTTPAHADFAVGQNAWLWWSVLKRPRVGAFRVLRAFGSGTSADGIRVFINNAHQPHVFWGNNSESYGAGTTSLVADDVWTFLACAVDKSSAQVVYKSGANAIQRVGVTLSGAGASTIPPRVNGDGASFDAQLFDLREAGFHSLGAAAVSDAAINEVAAYAAAKYGVAV